VLDDRPPELAALARVGGRVLERRPRQAGRRRGERDPRGVEAAHEPVEPLALAAQPMLGGHLDAGEEDLRAADRTLAELLHRRADREAGGVALDDERRHAARPPLRVHGGEDQVGVADPCVGDPRLLPVEHVAGVRAARPRLQAGGVRADLGLGDGERGQRRPGPGQGREPAGLLLGRAERRHRRGEEAVGGDEVADPDVAVAQRRLHQAAGEAVLDPAAPVLGGQHEVCEPDLRGGVDELPRHLLVGLVDGRGRRADPLGRERAGDRADVALLVGELERLRMCDAPADAAVIFARRMSGWPELLRDGVRDLGPYVPGSSAEDIRRRLGVSELVRLNWNEGLFGALPGVHEQVAGELDRAWMYPERAYGELRERLAAWLGVGREQILPGHGIQALVLTVASAFVAPGDRVVVPAPTYGLYAAACRAAGAEVERVPCPGLALDLERVAHAARRRGARLAWICDPNNPTGLRIGADEWAAFHDALPAGCVAVADEAYMDYVPEAERVDRLADVAAGRRLVVLRTFSKIFGLAGLRLGYAVVHESLTPLLHAVQEPFNVNCAALSAGCASLERVALLDERRELAHRCRALLRERLTAGGLEPLPSDANFVLTPLGGADDLAVVEHLARRGLLVRPGSEFGLPGYARITIGPAELMERAAAELLEATR
jgi:histidinol-phosphate aminotransferase